MKILQKAQQDVYLTKKQFEKDLETCLTILDYPNSKNKYYVCEYYTPALEKRILNIVVI